MAELLKDMFSPAYLRALADDIHAVYPAFRADDFIQDTMDETWQTLELKGRMRQITLNLGKYLPQQYSEALGVIDRVIQTQGNWREGFAMFFPDFIEVYGQAEADLELSIAALARYTPYASSEFAVRPFIIKHEARMMAQMLAWAGDENEDIRRLASEGCRPALPWAVALVKYKQDPSPILPILEALKDDPALYVRKSVANNLNDISKTHPALVVQIAKRWYGTSERTDWIVKHACRTLLKRGNPEALAIFGYHDSSAVDVHTFALGEAAVEIGGALSFSFVVQAKAATKVRLEYGIDFVKANGKQSRKIFQISELEMGAGQEKTYQKTHAFADLSTRKHYVGLHAITLIVNGTERGTLEFDVR